MGYECVEYSDQQDLGNIHKGSDLILGAYKAQHLERYRLSPLRSLRLNNKALIPTFRNPPMPPTDISTYLADRDTLIKRDRALRVDAIKLDDFSTTEAAADGIVRAMRAEEAVSVWGVEHEGIEHPFPGMEFLTSREVIVGTKVFKLLHKVRLLLLFILFRLCSGMIRSDRRVCVLVDAEGSFASRSFGRYRRRQLFVESDPGARSAIRPGFCSVNRLTPNRERPARILTVPQI